jgi:hypothetical protein
MTAAAVTAQTPGAAVQPPFDADYMLVKLGAVAGLPGPYGAVTFEPGDPNTILVLGGGATAALFSVGLTRDSTGSISGFDGQAVEEVSASAGGGPAGAYGPGGVFFYTTYGYAMGQVKPASTVTDKVIDLRALAAHPTGINVVPPGLGGAGTMKLVTLNYGYWYTVGLTPDGTGTYDVSAQASGPPLNDYPGGFTYVAPGSPGYIDPGLVLCETALSYGDGAVVRFDVDGNGDPIVNTRQVIVSGLDVPEGIAIDPPTGDLLFTSYQGWLYLVRHAPFPPTTTTTSTTTLPPTTTSTTKAPTTTTTSSTTLHPTTTTVPTTTSTTIAPTTSTTKPTTTSTSSTTLHPTTSTTSSTAMPTTSTSSTTIHPTSTTTSSTTLHATTSSTSTTLHPTTTSTSSTTSSTIASTSTTSSSTTTTVSPSSTTTTTLPTSCGDEPSFQAIACGVDALLGLVRSSSDLGSLQAGFTARLEQARATVTDGAAACTDGQSAAARRALDRLGRQMLLVRARTRTLRARKTIPRALAAAIADEARGIASGARALRAALQCP